MKVQIIRNNKVNIDSNIHSCNGFAKSLTSGSILQFIADNPLEKNIIDHGYWLDYCKKYDIIFETDGYKIIMKFDDYQKQYGKKATYVIYFHFSIIRLMFLHTSFYNEVLPVLENKNYKRVTEVLLGISFYAFIKQSIIVNHYSVPITYHKDFYQAFFNITGSKYFDSYKQLIDVENLNEQYKSLNLDSFRTAKAFCYSPYGVVIPKTVTLSQINDNLNKFPDGYTVIYFNCLYGNLDYNNFVFENAIILPRVTFNSNSYKMTTIDESLKVVGKEKQIEDFSKLKGKDLTFKNVLKFIKKYN